MEWFKKILGFKYVLNKNTGEIHSLTNMTKRCGFIDEKNRFLLSKHKLKKIIGKKYNDKLVNGCHWCLKKHDLG